MIICAKIPSFAGVWYFAGVYDDLPVFTLSRVAARRLSRDKAFRGAEWCEKKSLWAGTRCWVCKA